MKQVEYPDEGPKSLKETGGLVQGGAPLKPVANTASTPNFYSYPHGPALQQETEEGPHISLPHAPAAREQMRNVMADEPLHNVLADNMKAVSAGERAFLEVKGMVSERNGYLKVGDQLFYDERKNLTPSKNGEKGNPLPNVLADGDERPEYYTGDGYALLHGLAHRKYAEGTRALLVGSALVHFQTMEGKLQLVMRGANGWKITFSAQGASAENTQNLPPFTVLKKALE